VHGQNNPDWNVFGLVACTEQGNSISTSRKASGGVEGTQTLCQGSKCVEISYDDLIDGHSAVRKAYRNLGGEWEMGQESE
jgi:hypothetical protein